MVCISLVMLLASLIVPRFAKQPHAELYTDLDHLFSVITYLHYRAMATHTIQELFFDLEKQVYYFIKHEKKHEKRLHASTLFGYLPNAMGPPSSPTELITKPITFAQKNTKSTLSARFFPDGKISSGTIYLIDKYHTAMVALTTPVSETPYTRKYKYLENQWVAIQQKFH